MYTQQLWDTHQFLKQQPFKINSPFNTLSTGTPFLEYGNEREDRVRRDTWLLTKLWQLAHGWDILNFTTTTYPALYDSWSTSWYWMLLVHNIICTNIVFLPTNVKIKAYAKSIYQKVHKLRLAQRYINDGEFRTNIKMITALAFVSVKYTIPSSHVLATHSGDKEQPVLDYFETTHVGKLRRVRRLQPLFPYELQWNL